MMIEHALAADEWARSLPISEMTSLGWIENPKSWQDRIKVGFEFFGVRDLESWNIRYGPLLSSVLSALPRVLRWN